MGNDRDSSEARTYWALTDVVEEELVVAIAMQRPIDTPEGQRLVAELIADTVMRRFEVVDRRPDLQQPRVV
jgi:hypothetical protein